MTAHASLTQGLPDDRVLAAVTSSKNSERDRITLDLLVAGDPEGMERMIKDHGKHVRAFLRRRFGHALDHWELEEAMSLAAIRAWQAASRFNATRGQLRTWFAVVARNCALSLIAQHQDERYISLDGITPAVAEVATTPSEARRMQLIVDVHRGIGKLAQLQRSVLLADLNAGTTLPASVLAERFHSTIRSIYAARSRGRRELRCYLEGIGYGTGHDSVNATQLPPEQTG